MMNAVMPASGGLLKGPEMDARDFVWLAALGLAARGPMPAHRVRRILDELAAGLFSPLSELPAKCLDAMLVGGHLAEVPDRTDGGQRLALTPSGHHTLVYLLGRSIARPSTPMGHVGMRLKLAFLDLLAAPDRRRVLETLVETCETELGGRDGMSIASPELGRFGRLWFEHETEGLRRDINQLRDLIDLNDL